MGMTKIDIYNAALQRIGAKAITSLDSDTKEGNLCRRYYDNAVRTILRLHPWNFATKRLALPLNGTAPAFGYAKAYDLPPDYVSMISLEDPTDQYTIESGQLLTNADNGNCRYICYPENTLTYPNDVCRCIILQLASDMAMNLSNSSGISDRLLNELEQIALPRERQANTYEVNVDPDIGGWADFDEPPVFNTPDYTIGFR
jgi:hypothetical protein